MLQVKNGYALILALALVGSAAAAEKSTTNKRLNQGTTAISPGRTIAIVPGKNTAPVGTFGGVMELTESDCRLDGGTVVKPGDSRCGSLGAVYCRKPNGEAACINEQ